MNALRTRRIGEVRGRSLYVVERLEGPPTFSVGDSKDDGRNLIAAVLIGSYYRMVGYVVGERGRWDAYTEREWLAWARDRRRRLPTHRASRLTVAAAASVLVETAGGE